MRDIPMEAAHLREALRFGLVGVPDVVSWSDEIIGESETPESVFVGLSYMSKSHALDVLSVLQAMSEQVAPIEALPAVLGLAHERIKAETGYGRELARAIYAVFVQCDYEVPNELSQIGWFDDAYDLAASGRYGSVEDVQVELEKFTGKFKEHAKQRFK